MSQHDYVIDNQTGVEFRGDLNNVLNAIVTNNSGATAPTTTYAGMTWLDTSTADWNLKRRNPLDTDWVTILTPVGVAITGAADVSAQRTALGLGTAATYNVGVSANNVVQLNASAKLPAINAENLTNINASNIASGIVPQARLGTGTPDNTKYLLGDGTWGRVGNGKAIALTNDINLQTWADTYYPYSGEYCLTTTTAQNGLPSGVWLVLISRHASDDSGNNLHRLLAYGMDSSHKNEVYSNSNIQGVGWSGWVKVTGDGAAGISILTTVGTGSFIAPSSSLKVTVIGGGGGGGGSGGVNLRYGGNGGVGGIAIKYISGVSVGESISYTVGAKGIGGDSTPTAGTSGGTSSFGAYCSATGGAGGNGNSTTPGASGTGVGGDFNTGIISPASASASGALAGYFTYGISIIPNVGPLTSIPGAVYTGSVNAGIGRDGTDASGYAAGGGGAVSNGWGASGGDGAQGIIIVEWGV